jgi:distribution and morphology protein 10
MFGSLHLPEPRLDALMASKLRPRWLGLASVISTLPQSPPRRHPQLGSQIVEQDFETASKALPHIFLSLQHDNARWASDYSYSFPDSLFGFRVLHNFGVQPGGAMVGDEDPATTSIAFSEDASELGAGLKGRFSAGAEVYFSAATKSGGRALLCTR